VKASRAGGISAFRAVVFISSGAFPQCPGFPWSLTLIESFAPQEVAGVDAGFYGMLRLLAAALRTLSLVAAMEGLPAFPPARRTGVELRHRCCCGGQSPASRAMRVSPSSKNSSART